MLTKYRHMQDCFRQHPEIYAAELADNEDEMPPAETETPVSAESAKDTPEPPKEAQRPAEPAAEPLPSAPRDNENDMRPKLRDELEEKIPEEAHDATSSNKNVKQ